MLNLADLVNLDAVGIQDFRDLLNFENLANRPFSVTLKGYTENFTLLKEKITSSFLVGYLLPHPLGELFLKAQK